MANHLGRGGYSDIEKDHLLLVLAYCGGNAVLASKQLAAAKEDGQDVRTPSANSLRLLKSRNLERYLRLHEEHSGQIEQIAVSQARDTAVRAGELEHKILEKIDVQIEAGEEIDVKTLSMALKNVSTTRGISVDKLLILTNRPTQITDKRDVGAIIAAIARKAPGLIQLDPGEVEEEDDGPAQLPPGEDS